MQDIFNLCGTPIIPPFLRFVNTFRKFNLKLVKRKNPRAEKICSGAFYLISTVTCFPHVFAAAFITWRIAFAILP